MRQAALAAGLPPLRPPAAPAKEAEDDAGAAARRAGRAAPAPAAAAPAPPAARAAGRRAPAMLVTEPVRSGQRIYAQGADLIVIGDGQCRGRGDRRRQHPRLRHAARPRGGRAPRTTPRRGSSRCTSTRNWSPSPASTRCARVWGTRRSASAVQVRLRGRADAVRAAGHEARAAAAWTGFRQGECAMAEVIVVTSGKGGVGKTTTSAAFATGLAQRGQEDGGDRLRRRAAQPRPHHGRRAARGVRHRQRHPGRGEAQPGADPRQAGRDALHPAGQPDARQGRADQGRRADASSSELSKDFDYILCDSPAGIEKGALLALYFADQAIVVTNPEVSSVRDSDRILGVLQSKSKRAEEKREPVQEHLLVTRYDPGARRARRDAEARRRAARSWRSRCSA